MTKKTTDKKSTDKTTTEIVKKEESWIFATPGMDEEAFIESIMAWDSGWSGDTYLNFKKGIMQISNWKNKKIVEKVENARIIFLTQKYEIQEMYNKKERKFRTVTDTSEIYANKGMKSYLYKREYSPTWERTLYSAQEVADARTAKAIIEVILEDNKDYKKNRYTILYIDTPEWLIKSYLRYTQIAWTWSLKEPEENTFQFWRNEQRDYHKNLFTITPQTYEEWQFTVTYPLFKLEKKVADPMIIQKMTNIAKWLLLRDEEIMKDEDTEEPF